MKSPRIKTAHKAYLSPYEINEFPKDFPMNLGREIVYILATNPAPVIEGRDLERIFAKSIGGAWTPSNVGLDDVIKNKTAWGAKTVKSSNPFDAKSVRLISGRNSPSYSYGTSDVHGVSIAELAEQVLGIWNERVKEAQKQYEELRTVVLLKSEDLIECSAFEYFTTMYDYSKYDWKWNDRGNLIGLESNGSLKFTWQPHGSQFTITEQVPQKRLKIRILHRPNLVSQQELFKAIDFNDNWIQIIDGEEE